MKKILKTLLTLAIWFVTIGTVVVESKQTESAVFIQVWVPKDKLQELKKQCLSTTEIRIDYPEGDYAVLPCRVIQSGK